VSLLLPATWVNFHETIFVQLRILISHRCTQTGFLFALYISQYHFRRHFVTGNSCRDSQKQKQHRITKGAGANAT